MRRHVALAILAVCPVGLWASRITLKDGRTLHGKFLGGTSGSITFQDDNGVRRRFELNEIQTLDFSDQVANAGGTAGTNAGGAAGTSKIFNDRADKDSSRDRLAESRELPAGTELSVRTNEAIDSTTATEGRTYSSTVDRDVADGAGNIVVPRGSEAAMVIRRVNEGSTTGSPDLVLDLQSVMVNGRRYLVSTGNIQRSNQSGIGKNKRTGEYVGGGAVLGTLLGAIAGGGKGAAIGAVAGAAAGAGAQVLTKGKEVKVPAETQLTFRLDQPLRLQSVH